MKKGLSEKKKVILKLILIVIFSILAVASFFSMGCVWKFFESSMIQGISMLAMLFLSFVFGAAAVVTLEDLNY